MIGVMGSGAWGTAIAQLIAQNQQPVRLWGRDAALMESLRHDRENARYLPGCRLADAIEPVSDLASLAEITTLFMVIPSFGARAAMAAVQPHLPAGVPIISATKGFEPESHRRMSQVIADVCPGHPVGVLSGPNLAKEVMAGLPTPSVIASDNAAIGRDVQALLSHANFRVYTNDDVVGTELGGALKNTIAIAAGLVDELQLGANAKAGLMTRGLAEITRLGVAMGAQPATFAGLTGLGDLIATCSSPLSRNHQVGVMLAQGLPLAEALQRLGSTAEGVNTTRVALLLAAERDLEMPIAAAMGAMLEGRLAPQQAVRELMTRRPTQEVY
ncbi:MAG: NAD(P)-dependent glycerol-3-phosphate dehydrogenase [Candidatus Sericytochromatia bacterium]|nr:NAD(P)-dependent glycerol-3-phosphate dehydrogenase [Candidatus Sericytochromatia bacterium]